MNPTATAVPQRTLPLHQTLSTYQMWWNHFQTATVPVIEMEPLALFGKNTTVIFYLYCHQQSKLNEAIVCSRISFCCLWHLFSGHRHTNISPYFAVSYLPESFQVPWSCKLSTLEHCLQFLCLDIGIWPSLEVPNPGHVARLHCAVTNSAISYERAFLEASFGNPSLSYDRWTTSMSFMIGTCHFLHVTYSTKLVVYTHPLVLKG